MRPRTFFLIFLIYSFIFLFSCDNQMVYDQFDTIENSSWKWDDKVKFSFSIADTSQLNNIYVRLRHSTEYPLSNLYMFIDIDGPSGQSMRDTINFVLAENSGKWKGSGIRDIREIGYLYRRTTKFPEEGTYSVTLEQAMRLPEVPVKEVGIRVERVQ